MTLYGIIYDWFYVYVWTDTSENGTVSLSDFVQSDFLGQSSVSLSEWLCHTSTIITLIALCLFLFLAVKWVFNIFRNTLERVGK